MYKKDIPCPVCDYPRLPYGTEFGEICPCCGTMFGVSEEDFTFAELRQKWVDGGRKWWDKVLKDDREESNANH